MTDPDRLRRLLGGPDTTWLVKRIRHRLERGGTLTGIVSLARATPSQRRAVELLLGRRAGTGASLSVSLTEVDRVLRESGASPGGLAAAVEALDGPVRDLAREQADLAAAWTSAFAPLDEALASRPELAEWRDRLDSSGLVRRLTTGPDEATEMLRRLATVVRGLPAAGVPLGRFAAETCGNAHALDDGQPISTLAVSCARAIAGLPFRTDGGAESRRDTWAAVGVHLDELSSTVLCLGLPGDSTATGRMLAAMRGEPVSLTLRQLRHHPTPMRAGLVRICENPVVLTAAADALGASCPPLVCCNGRPSAAVWRLLELLAGGSAEFAYHGDFDWGGVAIATAVRDRIGWRPWRYDAAAYREAASDTPLAGRSAPTPWDPSLVTAMTERGVRVEEEQVLPHLISDLQAGTALAKGESPDCHFDVHQYQGY